MEHNLMSTLSIKELSHPSGEVIKIASGKTLDLNSQGTLVLPTIPHAKMPSGSVVQVVQGVQNVAVSSASASWTDTGLSASITPISTSSKIMVTIACSGIVMNCNYSGVKLVRGSTDVAANWQYTVNSTWVPITWLISYLDAPSTTSATTYKAHLLISGTSNYVRWNYVGNSSIQPTATITLMEIQG